MLLILFSWPVWKIFPASKRFPLLQKFPQFWSGRSKIHSHIFRLQLIPSLQARVNPLPEDALSGVPLRRLVGAEGGRKWPDPHCQSWECRTVLVTAGDGTHALGGVTSAVGEPRISGCWGCGSPENDFPSNWGTHMGRPTFYFTEWGHKKQKQNISHLQPISSLWKHLTPPPERQSIFLEKRRALLQTIPSLPVCLPFFLLPPPSFSSFFILSSFSLPSQRRLAHEQNFESQNQAFYCPWKHTPLRFGRGPWSGMN